MGESIAKEDAYAVVAFTEPIRHSWGVHSLNQMEITQIYIV